MSPEDVESDAGVLPARSAPPLCEEERSTGMCLGPQADSGSDILSNGKRVCYRKQGTWTWDLRSDPVKLADAGVPVLAVDDYCYFADQGYAWRVAFSGGQAPEKLAPFEGVFGRVWKTPTHVFGSSETSPGHADLWRVSRGPSANVEYVAKDLPHAFEAGNSAQVFRRISGGITITGIAAASLRDPKTETIVQSGMFRGLKADEKALYFEQDLPNTTLGRVLVGDLTGKIFYPFAQTEIGTAVRFHLDGDWIFFATDIRGEPNVGRAVRVSGDGEIPPLELKRVTNGNPWILATVGDRVVYYADDMGHLASAPTPKMACSDTRSCPSAMRCDDGYCAPE